MQSIDATVTPRTTQQKRLHNFSAGPAILPEDVLLEVREELPVYKDIGASVLEISHRSATYTEIGQSAKERLKNLLGMSDEWHILFLQGGASMQFHQVPLNFLPPGGSADYLVTGEWSKKAIKPQLELIVRAGAGYDTIDVRGASDRGIFVANCPGKNSDAVAELTIGMMLALDRRIPDNVKDAREGRWNKAAYSKAGGIRGRTLGIVGLGNIGRRVAEIGRALGMRVIAWSRSLTDEAAEELEIERRNSPRDVAADADVITLHVAATPDTHHLADRAFFEAMREGAYFINTTRGSVVDEGALKWAMEEKGVLAALDVIEGEPEQKEGVLNHPLSNHPDLYLTHHIGASTEQAQEATAAEAVRIIISYGETGNVPNCVNLEEHSPATHLMTVRHRDKVGVLAAVLDEVRKAEWNVQEMENLIFEGAKAACARIRFNGRPQHEVIARIEDHPDVLAVSLIAL